MALVNLSYCQSIPNWICNIMLCQLFLCVHLTDKTIIKLMKTTPQNSLAEKVEMKALFFATLNSFRLQNLTSGTDECSTRPGPDQQPARPVRLINSFFQIGITALRHMNFNGNVISFCMHLHVLLQRWSAALAQISAMTK